MILDYLRPVNPLARQVHAQSAPAGSTPRRGCNACLQELIRDLDPRSVQADYITLCVYIHVRARRSLGNPGIVSMVPHSAYTKPASAESRTSRTGNVKPVGRPFSFGSW